MAVTDVEKTDQEIVQLLNDESPWEVIDGIDNLPKGHYLVTVEYWWEDNFPEAGCSLISEVSTYEKANH